MSITNTRNFHLLLISKQVFVVSNENSKRDVNYQIVSHPVEGPNSMLSGSNDQIPYDKSLERQIRKTQMEEQYHEEQSEFIQNV